jgi:predicted aspartyl protease
MPVIKGIITEEGGLVRVSIGWSSTAARNLRLARRAVPIRLEAKALIDTGAEVTCLDPKLIEDLGLPYEGPVLANVPAMDGVSFASHYDASLSILHPSGRQRDHFVITDIPVLELSLHVLDYQMIIGRDVLKECMFLYNGVGRRFCLKY